VPFFLRKIGKAKWHKYTVTDPLQSDALADLKTSSNTLSVWLIKDDKSNLEQVITALISSCDRFSNCDYVLIDINLVDSIGIKHEEVEGQTPYAVANQWHRDLIDLTVDKIFNLAKVIEPLDKGRFPEKNVKNLIREAYKNGQIDETKLMDKMKIHLIPNFISQTQQEIQDMQLALSDSHSKIQELSKDLKEVEEKFISLNTDASRIEFKIGNMISESTVLKFFDAEKSTCKNLRNKGSLECAFNNRKLITFKYMGQPKGKRTAHLWRISAIKDVFP